MFKLTILVTCFLVICANGNIKPAEDYLGYLAKWNRDFASALFKEIAKSEKSNFLFSPVSIESVLAMTAEGASGETLRQIHSGLHLPNDEKLINNAFRNLNAYFKPEGLYVLNSANKLYVKNDFDISPTYKQLVQNVFRADIESIDFGQSAQSAEVINNWVSAKTNGKINELISAEDLSTLTRLILLNAVYFKADWRKPFDKFDTIIDNFYVEDGSVKKVDMMQITEYFNYAEDPQLDAKFLEMPYHGGEVSMVIVVPNKKDGIRILEERPESVFKARNMTKTHIRVLLPKFSISTSLKLKEYLQNIGIQKVFTPEAELTGIAAGNSSLYVDKMVQKTFINVTEKGTEAAAVTSGGVVALSISPHEVAKLELTADHPFLFFLRINHNRKQEPLVFFIGRFNDPE